MKYFIKVSLISIFILSSCSAPKLTKRYKSADNVWIANKAVKDYVKVETQAYKTSTKTEEKKENVSLKTFFDFPMDSQEEIIIRLAKRNPNFSVSELLKEVNAKSKSDGSKNKEGLTTYKTKFQNNIINKNIVFSVTRVFTSDGKKFKTINNVGDRIQYLDLELDIINASEVRFVNWNKFENDYTTVDFGTITSSKSITAEVSVGYEANAGLEVSDSTTDESNTSNTNTIGNTASETFGTENDGSTSSNMISNVNTNVLVNTLKNINIAANKLTESTKIAPNAKISGTDKLDESRQFKNEILKLTGTLKPNKFEIKQEGYEGINLKGNTSINIDIKFDGDYSGPITLLKFDNLYKKDENGLAPNIYDKINKHYTNLFLPQIERDVKAEVGYKYLYRSIRGGDQYIPEYRQRVKFLFGQVPNDSLPDSEEFVLVRKSDFIPTLYQIKSGDNFIKLDGKDLIFETKTDAMNFISWLIFSDDSTFYSTKLNIQDLSDLKIADKKL